ncbi:hypothetical protein N665_0058s0054 [Sinapis alba]|nr:hypothetical protein N665_0058s0054 [Sinapis alba]
MRGRFGIRGCIGKKKNVCGLLSLPDDVFVDCLAQLSRSDLVALAMVSRRHRYIAVSRKLWAMRHRMDSVDPYMYVFMHMYPDPSPRWFVLHPVQRRLRRVHPRLFPAALAGSCFVTTDSGIYTIGGLINGKPTSEVTYFDCIDHAVYCIEPMKMPRSGASASLIKEDGKKKKIYVFGGCWDHDDVTADSSNWVEAYDFETRTWEFLSVSTPKMPLKIKESMVMGEKRVYAVDEDGELFIFSTSECKFWAGEEKESDPENKNDWHLFDYTFFCRGVGGRILWRSPSDLDWKEVKGLEELQQQHIIKICGFSVDRMAIFWSQGPAYQTLELWVAEISLKRHWVGEELEVWGNIEWSVMVSRTMGGFTINIIDTPGLVEAGYVNHQALELIKGFLVNRTIDVLLYVDRLDVYRVDELDKQVVQAITQTFGKEIWCKTLLVLTHAQFSPPDDLSYEIFSSKRSDSLLKTIRAGSKMRKQQFEDSAIEVVYAENSGRCSKNDKEEKALPNGEAWIPNLVKAITDVATNQKKAIHVDKKMVDGSYSDEKGKKLIPLIIAAQWFVVKMIQGAIKNDIKISGKAR